jgi:hypothetical protein
VRNANEITSKTSSNHMSKTVRDTSLARIIHGFWESCEELASFAKHFQFDCQMLDIVQAETTEIADLEIERAKNAFSENTPALVCCDFLEPGRLVFSKRGSTRRRLGEVPKCFPDLHEQIASGPA